MKSVVVFVWLFSLAVSLDAEVISFSNDFNLAIPPEIDPGAATLTGVQGFAGLGPSGNQFEDNFLRSPTGSTVTLTLEDLPGHTAINLEFLFAAIDSLDGTGNFPSGDFFKITLDGNQIFRESFANALESQIQSYVPPPGVELARHVDLGFGGPGSFPLSVFTDSAYNLGADPNFANLPHSASTAVFTFEMEGPGVQPLTDESWAIDNLRVTLTTLPGDFDFDSDVDGIDFLKWQQGESTTPLSPEDLADWEAYYGFGPFATATAVPEPASWLLVVAPAGVLLRRLRRACPRVPAIHWIVAISAQML